MDDTLQAIDDLLMELHERIRSGRCLTSRQQNIRMLGFLKLIANKDERINKQRACEYVGVSRATFDRMVKIGKMPMGKHTAGWKELSWSYKELDEYINRLF